MNNPPFKRGDRVMAKRAVHGNVVGTVFWVKQNTEDDYRYRGRRGYVKVASKGGWTVGVEWESQLRFPVSMLSNMTLGKYVQAGNLVLMTPEDEARFAELQQQYPHPECVECGAPAVGARHDGAKWQHKCKDHYRGQASSHE